MEDALREQSPDDRDFVIRFFVVPTTSFAERTTDQGTSSTTLIRQTDLLSNGLISCFEFLGRAYDLGGWATAFALDQRIALPFRALA